MEKLIAYYRVSTIKQGQSGLGLDAQKAAVDEFRKSVNGTIVESFTEIESGKRNDRPQLAKAISKARSVKARLVIAKLDRLARNVLFVAQLMESGVDFVCCDMPTAGKLTLHVISAVSEDECRRISERTKAALQAAKARGTKLGTAREGHLKIINWRKGLTKAQPKGLKVFKANAAKLQAECYGPILNDVKQMSEDGASLREIADELNKQNLTTVRGKPFQANTIKRLLTTLPVIALTI